MASGRASFRLAAKAGAAAAFCLAGATAGTGLYFANRAYEQAPAPCSAAGSIQARPACTPPSHSFSLSLNPSSGSAGQIVTAIVTGSGSDSELQFYFQGESVGQAISNNKGTARFSFAVPSLVSDFPGQTFIVIAVGPNAESVDATFTAK